jgi:hypothetical protein
MPSPIYQGGGEYSAVRQSKETVGQQRLNLDVNRDQARATVVQSWGQLDAAKAQIESTTAQVNSSEIALNGVREEARVGQRTTLDVLNAQQELVNARVALVTAQHDRVVASYTLLAAVGALSMQRLGLNVQVYDPMVHYQQVRDAWVGLRKSIDLHSAVPSTAGAWLATQSRGETGHPRGTGRDVPWIVDENERCLLIVRDHNGHALAYVYFRGGAGTASGGETADQRRSPAHRRQHRQAAGAAGDGMNDAGRSPRVNTACDGRRRLTERHHQRRGPAHRRQHRQVGRAE